MSVFSSGSFAGHELVTFCHDRPSRLHAIIAVHDTTLGPALGGCRMWPFASDDDALRDELRLSRAMTYKAAVAGLALGGGKSVIIADPRRDKTSALIEAFARCVDALGGRYIMAEDVGTGVADMDLARRITRHVAGVSAGRGDPSPATARGVFAGIRAALAHTGRGEDLRGRRIAVQGLGHVGRHLCRLLRRAGAILLVADLDPQAVAWAVAACDATAVAADDILAIEADVFAPCALGGVIDDRAIERLRAPIVAGSANNQLATPDHGAALGRRGILYAPDYVINAGGLMQVAADLGGEGDEALARRIDGIAATLALIFRRAEAEGLPTDQLADRLAEERLAAAGRPGWARPTELSAASN